MEHLPCVLCLKKCVRKEGKNKAAKKVISKRGDCTHGTWNENVEWEWSDNVNYFNYQLLIVEIDGPNANKSVKNENEVTFLLRKILQIPKDSYCSFTSIGDPAVWIDCCTSCSALVEDAREIFHQLKILQERFDKLQNELKNTIIQSVQSESRAFNISKQFRLTRAVRSYFQNEISSATDDVKIEDHSDFEFELSDCIELQKSPSGSRKRKQNLESQITVSDFVSESIFGDDPLEEFENSEVGVEASMGYESQQILGRAVSRGRNYNGSDLDHAKSSSARSRKQIIVERTTYSDSDDDENIFMENCSTKLYKCGACKRIFNGETFIRNHLKTHTTTYYKTMSAKVAIDGESFNCRICGESFAALHAAKFHFATHRPDELDSSTKTLKDAGVENNNCSEISQNIQGETTDTNQGGNIFIKHTPVDLFKCSACQKLFNGQEFIKNHLKTHAAGKLGRNISARKVSILERPFTCSLCGESFTDFFPVKSHMATHDVLQPLEPNFEGFDEPFEEVTSLEVESQEVSSQELSIQEGATEEVTKEEVESDSDNGVPFCGFASAGRTCAISQCTTEKRRKYKGAMSWHTVPSVKRDKELRRKWIDVIRKSRNDDSWQPGKSSYVCCRHFQKKNIMRLLNRTLLHSHAIPQINPPKENTASKVIPKVSQKIKLKAKPSVSQSEPAPNIEEENVFPDIEVAEIEVS